MPQKTNRRKFLASTGAIAAAATAPLLHARTARSYAQIPGANDRIRLGIIGPGGRGTNLASLARRLGAEIVALADANRGMLELARRRLEAPSLPTYVDYANLLARTDVDGVINATPDHLHHKVILDTIAAGKDIYTEKPLARTIEEGADLAEKVKSSKQVVQVGNQRRSGEHFRRAREVIESGGIGDVRFVRIWDFRFRPVDPYLTRSRDASLFAPELVDWNLFLGPAPKRPYDPVRASGWRWYWDYAGGLLTDIGPHWLDVAMWLTGSDGPLSVACNGGNYQSPHWETPDNVHAVLDCGSFSVVFMVQFMNGHDYDGASFYGLEGTIVQENDKKLMVQYDKRRNEVARWPVEEESPAHMQNFFDCMRSRREPNSPVELAHRVLVGAHLGNESFLEGKQVRWDPVRLTRV